MLAKYFLKLDHFEGPLDLLLYLIRVHEIDIFDIDVYRLTTQYMDYLRLVEFADLATAGEFLEMAATLIEIKSRFLLPKESKGEGTDDSIEEDPRLTLQQRLIEYETYKNVGAFLEKRPQVGVQILTGWEWQRLEEVFADVERPLRGDVSTLTVLFDQMLRTMGERRPHKVEAKTHMVSVEEKIFELNDLIDQVRFTLYQGFYDKFNSRYEMVVYTLAMLELVKAGKVRLYQQELFGPLWMYKSDLELSQLPVGVGSHQETDHGRVDHGTTDLGPVSTADPVHGSTDQSVSAD